MFVENTQILQERAYHENLRTLYRILLRKYPDSNLIIWGAGKGFEVPTEYINRIIAMDIDERLVEEMRKRGINAVVGNFLEDYINFGSKNDIISISLLLSQLLYLGESKYSLSGIISQLKELKGKIVVIDAPFSLNNLVEVTGNSKVSIFSCNEYYKSELFYILRNYPITFLCSSDGGPIIVNPFKDYHLYVLAKQWLLFAWLINFEKSEIKEILREYVSKVGKRTYLSDVDYLKRCVNIIKKNKCLLETPVGYSWI